MGKIVNSPVPAFPGTVTIIQPVPYSAFIAWELGLERILDSRKKVEAGELSQGQSEPITWDAIKCMIESWNIEGFDIDNPRSDPRASVIDLMSWVMREISAVLNGDLDVKK